MSVYGTSTQTPLADKKATNPMRTEPDPQDARCLFFPIPFLLYLPLFCQAPLQVSVPRLAGIQFRLQLLPRLTDRAHSQSESQTTPDLRHIASFRSKCKRSNVWWNRMLFKGVDTEILRYIKISPILLWYNTILFRSYYPYGAKPTITMWMTKTRIIHVLVVGC